MKHSEGHYFRGGSWISVSLLLLSLSNLSWSRLPSPLPTSIRILGIFDKGGDPKHIMGFKAAIDKINAKQDINQDGMPTLFNTKIEAETLQIPPGAR